jgi:ATP-dependent Lhr-like helicase
MIRLLLGGWFEPPDVAGLHASTFIQQVLSVVAERGGATAAALWSTLVQDGPFGNIDKGSFLAILREMGARDLLVQDRTGVLLHGGLGEKFVNSYDFYAAFVTDDEFTLQHEGRTLGSLPISRPLIKDQRLIFGGRRWRVVDADDQRKVISVLPDSGGAPPTFDSAGAKVHDVVRQEMKVVLASEERIPFLDDLGQTFLAEARRAYGDARLNSRILVASENDVLVFPWSGDKVNDALCLMLSGHGCAAWNEGLAVRVQKCRATDLEAIFRSIAVGGSEALATRTWSRTAMIREKWDWALPSEVLMHSFTSSQLDIERACLVAKKGIMG